MTTVDIRKVEPHPAAQWAVLVGFDPEQADCTTAVVFKILDNKCKMLPGEKQAVMAIYEVVRHLTSTLFDNAVHHAISAARLSFILARSDVGISGIKVGPYFEYAPLVFTEVFWGRSGLENL